MALLIVKRLAFQFCRIQGRYAPLSARLRTQHLQALDHRRRSQASLHGDSSPRRNQDKSFLLLAASSFELHSLIEVLVEPAS